MSWTFLLVLGLFLAVERVLVLKVKSYHFSDVKYFSSHSPLQVDVEEHAAALLSLNKLFQEISNAKPEAHLFLSGYFKIYSATVSRLVDAQWINFLLVVLLENIVNVGRRQWRASGFEAASDGRTIKISLKLDGNSWVCLLLLGPIVADSIKVLRKTE